MTYWALVAQGRPGVNDVFEKGGMSGVLWRGRAARRWQSSTTGTARNEAAVKRTTAGRTIIWLHM